MEKIRLCIAGVTGWIGKPLARAVIKSVDFDLVGGVSRKNSGDDLGKILEIPGFSLTISESVSEALNKKPMFSSTIHRQTSSNQMLKKQLIVVLTLSSVLPVCLTQTMRK